MVSQLSNAVITFLFNIVMMSLAGEHGVAVAVIFSPAIVTIFTKEQHTWELASVGFRIFAVNFLFSGINITSSGFFTALSNGKVSALISFSRTLVFIVVSLLILPRIFDITGAWLAIPVAEFLTLLISGWMHRKYFLVPGRLNYL